jgi:DNA-binding MarR family transcriptional regulator
MAGDVRRRRMSEHIAPEEYVPYFVNLISNAITTSGSQMYLRRFGVGMNDWRVLSYVGMDPGVTAQEVSNHTRIDKSVISRSVKSLVENGLVIVESSPGFRRLYLTKDGAKLYKALVPVAMERERILLEGLDDDEVEELLRLLRKLRDNLPALGAFEPVRADTADGDAEAGDDPAEVAAGAADRTGAGGALDDDPQVRAARS